MWARHRSNARSNVEQTVGVRLHVPVHYIEFQTRISRRILVSNHAISGGQGTRKPDYRATRAGLRHGKSGNFHKGVTKSSMKLAFLPFRTWLGPKNWNIDAVMLGLGLGFTRGAFWDQARPRVSIEHIFWLNYFFLKKRRTSMRTVFLLIYCRIRKRFIFWLICL
jgi:hypothetical protein